MIIESSHQRANIKEQVTLIYPRAKVLRGMNYLPEYKVSVGKVEGWTEDDKFAYMNLLIDQMVVHHQVDDHTFA